MDDDDGYFENGNHAENYLVPHPGLDLSYGIEDYIDDQYDDTEAEVDDHHDQHHERRSSSSHDGEPSSSSSNNELVVECYRGRANTNSSVTVSDLGDTYGGAPPSSHYQQQPPTQRPRTNVVVSFATTIPRTLGGDTVTDSNNSPTPCSSYAVSSSNNRANNNDNKNATNNDKAVTTTIDGISFSTVSKDSDSVVDSDTKKKVATSLAPAVDAVPSAFNDDEDNNNNNNTINSITKSIKQRYGLTFRSRRRNRNRNRGNNDDDERGEGTVAPTASMSGTSPSRRTTLTKSNKDNDSHNRHRTSTSSRTHRAILHTKITFFTFLLLIALLTGYFLHTNLRTTETAFAKSTFQSIATRAVRDSADVVSRKRLSMATMATVIGESFRKEDDWPNVAVEGYERIVNLLAQTGSHTNMGFAPIVKVTEQPSFESFAYSYFASRPDYYPNTTGVNSPDWRGIWRIQNRTRIHDADASTQQRGILTPIIQCCIDNPGDKILLFNLHSEPQRRKTIDGIIECAKRIRQANEAVLLQQKSTKKFFDTSTSVLDGIAPNSTAAVTRTNENTLLTSSSSHPPPDYSCGSMTEFVKIVRFKTRGPASIMFQPIFPAESPWEILGLVLSPMAWDEVFEAVFASNMNGVHAVLESETRVHTYTIANGQVESFQEGDLHQTKYDEFGVSTNLTWNDLHQMGAPMYKLSLYPTDDFVKSYSTTNPMNATITALSIIVFISILFLVYDYFVRREFLERHQLLEAKRRFIRFVSHEVRTPLNAVLMGLNIIEAEMEADEDRGDGRYTDRLLLLREVQNSTESAVDVLNDVLLYDKIESSLKLEVSMVHVWHVVERTLSEFKRPAQRQGVHLRTTFETSTTDGDCPYDVGLRVSSVTDLPEDVQFLCVAGDASRIAQVLRNLLSNALKFTPEDGSILVTASYHMTSMDEERRVKWKGSSSWVEKIELHNKQEVLATPRGHFQLTVQDTGVGMSPDEIIKLFGEGVQFNAHALQAGKGSGLGLFIAKGLVNQHNGTLEATSEGLDKGATFTLKLPLYHVPDLSSESDEHQETSTSVSDLEKSNNDETPSCAEDRDLRLLVVDDHPSNRKLLCRLLESKGHQCDMAENGQVALEMVRDTMWGSSEGDEALEPYDCILMDYEMPVMNGPTASSLIRELGCDVFIIGITGNVLSDDVQYFKSRGANAILPKPFQLSTLEDLFMEHQLTF